MNLFDASIFTNTDSREDVVDIDRGEVWHVLRRGNGVARDQLILRCTIDHQLNPESVLQWFRMDRERRFGRRPEIRSLMATSPEHLVGRVTGQRWRGAARCVVHRVDRRENLDVHPLTRRDRFGVISESRCIVTALE